MPGFVIPRNMDRAGDDSPIVVSFGRSLASLSFCCTSGSGDFLATRWEQSHSKDGFKRPCYNYDGTLT